MDAFLWQTEFAAVETLEQWNARIVIMGGSGVDAPGKPNHLGE